MASVTQIEPRQLALNPPAPLSEPPDYYWRTLYFFNGYRSVVALLLLATIAVFGNTLSFGATDFALLGYMLHEAEEPADFLKEVRRIMKAGARLCVLDWKRKVEAHGPPMRERLSKAKAVRLIRDAGFSSVSLSSLTRSHFRILARKPKA